MPTLYLTEQNTTLRKVHNRLVIERNDEVVASIHDFNVERVVIFGNVQVTSHPGGLFGIEVQKSF